MNFLDIILSIFLIFGLLKGFYRGLFKESISLISFILGIYIAIHYNYLTKNIIKNQIISWDFNNNEITATFITFILAEISIILFLKLFNTLALLTKLNWINMTLGCFFGFLRSTIILSIILYIFEKYNDETHYIKYQTIEKSTIYHPILNISYKIYPIIQKWFKEKNEKLNQ